MTIPNIRSSDMAFAELNRALGRIGDSNVTSLWANQANIVDSNLRTPYALPVAGQYLAGCSFQNISDWAFAAQGSPADQIAIEIVKAGATDTTAGGIPTTSAHQAYAERWGRGWAFENTNLYIWVLFDSVVVVLPDGTCQIRK